MDPLASLHPKARAIVFTIVAGGLLLVVTGLALVTLKKSQQADRLVTHSNDVIRALRGALILLLDAEASERGYLLTDQDSFLSTPESLASPFDEQTQGLLDMVADNPAQHERVRQMRAVGLRRLRLMDDIVADRRREAIESYGVALRQRMDRGETLMQDVQGRLTELQEVEVALLQARRQTKERFERIATAIILSATGLLLVMGAGLVRIQRDLDRREKLEARLVKEKAERERLIRDLERSNRDLDQFAYAASHDLKAPLRGINNLSLWIEEDLADRITAQSRGHLEKLRGRVDRLEKLIDGILSYSRAGQRRAPAEAVDVGKLLRNVLDLLSPADQATVVIGANMPVLRSEPVLLQQVFQNLIDNALKHGRAEQPRVQIQVADSGFFWEFSVRDNGPGIAPEYHERIWGVFQTLESRDKTGGTGIGLATVRKIAESRGGAAWVESTPGQGAVFHVAWPKRVVDDDPRQETT